MPIPYSPPQPASSDHDPTVTMWEFLNTARWIMLGKALRGRRDVVVPLRRTPKYEVMLPQIVEMAEAGSGIDLISRALGIGAEVVRDALYLHRTGKRPPGAGSTDVVVGRVSRGSRSCRGTSRER